MKPNPGYLPSDAVGRRVRVHLVGDKGGQSPREWQADGKAGCRWSKTGHPFDIACYEVIE